MIDLRINIVTFYTDDIPFSDGLKMKRSIIILIIATTGLFSCGQDSRSTPGTVDKETINSVRKYKYTDSAGGSLIIENSVPKGGINYSDANGKKYIYAVFFTRITNETADPFELKIDFPVDSFEFPLSSGKYMKLLIPSDTVTPDKEPLYDYGLATRSFLDTGINKSYSLKRTIDPKGSTAFYVLTFSNQGSGGILRTGLSLKGQDLFYRISCYSSTHDLSLMDEKEINCGSINLKNLILQK